jgi:hypothetical protein
MQFLIAMRFQPDLAWIEHLRCSQPATGVNNPGLQAKHVLERRKYFASEERLG